jgi:hypothetical protein
MFKIVTVKTLPKHILWLKYEDGVEGCVDVSHLVGKGVFKLWDKPGEFEKVSIGSAGELVWSDTADLCPDALYMEITGKTPDSTFPGLSREPSNA